jgi:hypothetical protein
VLRQPAEELDPRVAGCPGDAHPDARISIHRNV